MSEFQDIKSIGRQLRDITDPAARRRMEAILGNIEALDNNYQCLLERIIALSENAKYTLADSVFDTIASAAVTPVSDIHALNDGNEINVTEVNNTPGVKVQVNFSGIERLDGLVVQSYYNGSSSHYMEIQFHNYVTGADDPFIRLDHATSHNYRAILIPDNSIYVSAGNVQVVFDHPPAGVPAHNGIFIDFLALLTL